MKKLILILIYISIQLDTNAQCYPDRHSTNWFDSWISCSKTTSPNPANPVGHWLLFDLGKRYQVGKIKIWNHNDPSNLNWGASKIKIEYSGNKRDWYFDRIIDLSKAPGNNRYEGMDWIDLSVNQAQYILLTVEETFGKESCAGLAEVQFEVENVLISETEDPIHYELAIEVKPNPFQNHFYADLHVQAGVPAEYQIIDMMGKVWSRSSLDPARTIHTVRVLTDEWPSGPYVLSIKQNAKSTQRLLMKIK